MANDQNWYTPIFKAWQTKLLGPKPTPEQLADVHNLKAAPGKQALATAMALRDCGVTNPQIMIACGNPQLNKMKGFVTDALLKRIPMPPNASNHKVYKLELTPKGRQRIARSVQADEKLEAAGKVVEGEQPAKRPSKAKGAVKGPSKAKAKAHVKAATTPRDKAQAIVDVAAAQFEGKPLEQAIAEREADTAQGENT